MQDTGAYRSVSIEPTHPTARTTSKRKERKPVTGPHVTKRAKPTPGPSSLVKDAIQVFYNAKPNRKNLKAIGVAKAVHRCGGPMEIPVQLRGTALNIIQHRFNETLETILRKCENVNEKLKLHKLCWKSKGCEICFPDAEEPSDEHNEDDPPGYIDPPGPVQYTPTDAAATSSEDEYEGDQEEREDDQEERESDQDEPTFGFHDQNRDVQRAFINIPIPQRKPRVIKKKKTAARQ